MLPFIQMMSGNLTVKAGSRVWVYGIICGNATVETDGELTIEGQVDGDVWNEGGKLDIAGTVHGNFTHTAGVTTMRPTAKVTR